MLSSTRISTDIAVAAARQLSAAGWRTPHRLLDSTWQQRVDALGRAHYRRYDESTATKLEEQDVWPELSPFLDGPLLDQARDLGLPGSRTSSRHWSLAAGCAPLAAALTRARHGLPELEET